MPNGTNFPQSPKIGAEYVHLLVEPDGSCWWCQKRPATTGEHKYKRSDLKRMMGNEEFIGWHDGAEDLKIIRGKSGINRDRYGVIKFPKSMCGPCNNAHSQIFDKSYEIYSDHLARHDLRLKKVIKFELIYDSYLDDSMLNLARYYAKHFGCRMVDRGFPVPASLRDFLNGATDMPDATMTLASTDSIHEVRAGLSISGDAAWVAKDRTRFMGIVMVSYVGPVGVRYEWRESVIPDDERSQFFHFPHAILNRYEDEAAVIRGEVRKQGLSRVFARERMSRTGSLPLRGPLPGH